MDKLDINSDVFEKLRTDFNTIITGTLQTMRIKGSDSAVFTVKLSLELENLAVIDDTDPGGTRMILKPVFKHKISSVMQMKSEISGSPAEEYELVQSSLTGDFNLVPINSEQMKF